MRPHRRDGFGWWRRASRRADFLPVVWIIVVYVLANVAVFVERFWSGSGSCTEGFRWDQALYKVMRLFVVEGDWVWGEGAQGKSSEACSNWVKLVAFLAPLAAGFSLVLAVSKALRRNVLISIRRWIRGRPSTVTIGPKRDCQIFGRSVHRARRRPADIHPRVILSSGSEDDLDDLWEEGATATRLHGDMKDALRRAGAAQADHVVSFLEEDDAQAELMSELARLCEEERGNGPPLDLWLHSADAGHGWTAFSGAALRDPHPGIRVGIFDRATIAARELFERVPVDVLADLQLQERVHVMIHGGDTWALAVAREAAMVCQTASAKRPKVTLLGAKALAQARRLKNEAPALGARMEVDSILLEASSDTEPDALLAALPRDATLHVVVIEDGTSALEYAGWLRRILVDPAASDPSGEPPIAPSSRPRAHPAPIFVRVDDQAEPATGAGPYGWGRVLEDGSRKSGIGLSGFGGEHEILALDSIVPKRTQDLAKKVHEVGYSLWNAPAEEIDEWVSAAANPRPALDQKWNELPFELQESNRRVARHLPLKARASGFRIQEGTEHSIRPGELASAVGEDLLETLSRMEHDRWFAERSMNGAIPGSKRSASLRLHPELVPYEDLGRAQEIDRRQLEALPIYLASVGEGLRPQLSIAVIGHGPRRLPDDGSTLLEQLEGLFGQVKAHPLPGNLRWAPVLLSNCAPGSDLLGARAAIRSEIPLWVALPLPADIYAELLDTDAEAQGPRSSRTEFLECVSRAEVCVTVPTAGPSSRELWERDDLREEQYLRAGRLICRRSAIVIAIVDPDAPETTVTKQLISEIRDGSLAADRDGSAFFPDPVSHEVIELDPRSRQRAATAAMADALHRIARGRFGDGETLPPAS